MISVIMYVNASSHLAEQKQSATQHSKPGIRQLHTAQSSFQIYQLQSNPRGAMAYPMSLFTVAPQTPKTPQNNAILRNEKTRNTCFRGFSRRIIVCALTALLVLLWSISALTKSSKQTDGISSSHDLILEQVKAVSLSEFLLTTS